MKAALALVLLAAPAWACPSCRPIVQSGIHNGLFTQNLALMMLPLLVLLTLALAIHFSDEITARIKGVRS